MRQVVRRDEGRERSDRAGDLGPAAAGVELRMAGERGNIVQRAVGDARRIQASQDFESCVLAEFSLDKGFEFNAVLQAVSVAGVAPVLSKLGQLQDLRAEAAPLALVLDSEVDRGIGAAIAAVGN